MGMVMAACGPGSAMGDTETTMADTTVATSVPTTGAETVGATTAVEDPTVCGDGVVEGPETCDDGNVVDNDGCDADCQVSAVKQVAAGHAHVCILSRVGSVKCWGDGGHGRLGYGDTKDRGLEESVASLGFVSLPEPVIQMAASVRNTCVVLESGAVYCWGGGEYGVHGQADASDLGDDELPSDGVPVDLGERAIEVSVASGYACALLEAGQVRCWGTNEHGALGYPGRTSVANGVTPAQLGDVDIGAFITQIGVGGDNACALTTEGQVKCWGRQPGYGNEEKVGDDEPPSAVGWIDLGERAVSISADSGSRCVVTESASVRCWGYGGGALGYGHREAIGDDEAVKDAGTVQVGWPVMEVAKGRYHTCARSGVGTVRCWGAANMGQLGAHEPHRIELGYDEHPSEGGLVAIDTPLAQVSLGYDYSCAVSPTGDLWCWGDGLHGVTGHGITEPIGLWDRPNDYGPVKVFVE